MLFNSVQFLIFFPLVVGIYFFIPHRYRWFMLLVASCIFYMAFIPIYIGILAVTILIDYWAGILIENSSQSKQKKTYLTISIISTCMVLFIFKYFNFFNSSFSSLAKMLHWNYPIEMLQLILPIGLSFHTFQSLSYVIEVYRGRQKAERHFGIYSLYVMFFPQLVAGPIERPQNLIPQFYEKHSFDYQSVADGLKLMAWGLFKKVVIADRLAILVNQVYNSPQEYSGMALFLATVFFAWQIYCDFSGYSDIARGAAQVLGFRLMINFNRPYGARSIPEFWKRWHISLSTWFKDYLYISLGGNRVSVPRWAFNLLITFIISGLWHGANWTFIIWGALNGFFYICSVSTETIRTRIVKSIQLNRFPFLHNTIKVGITFFLISFSWIFFRSQSLSDALYICTHLFSGFKQPVASLAHLHFSPIVELFFKSIRVLKFSKIDLLVSMGSLICLFIVGKLQRTVNVRKWFMGKPVFLRWVVYYSLLLVIILFGKFGSNQFIYFQF